MDYRKHVRFERAAKGLDTGHRSLLADKVAELEQIRISSPEDAAPFTHAADLRCLASEFQLSQAEILDLIQSAPRLKTEFDLVAACLHPRTERWEFRYALTADLDPQDKCKGRLSNRARLDERWSSDPLPVLTRASSQ